MALAEKANTLNADAAVGWYHHTLYYYYYLKGDYERALEFRRLHPRTQQAIYAYIECIPVYGQLGRKKEALENWRKLLADAPGWIRPKASWPGITCGICAMRTSPS